MIHDDVQNRILHHVQYYHCCQVDIRVWHQVRSQVWGQVGNQVRNQVRNQLEQDTEDLTRI
jgi:hypothetical protein